MIKEISSKWNNANLLGDRQKDKPQARGGMSSG